MKRLFFLLTFTLTCITSNAQLTLDSCQALARENYPLIKQYGLVERSTEYSVSNAAKAYLPQVSFSAQATYQSDVSSFSDKMIAIYQQAGINMKGLNKDQYKVMLEVNQSIWDGGLTEAQKKIAKAEGDVSTQSVEKEMYALRDRINQLYFGILTLDAQLRQNTLLQELLESNFNTLQAGVKNGIAMQSDLDAIKAEQLSVNQQRVQIESAENAYRQMLSAMIGQPIETETTFEKPMETTVPTIVSEETNDRPELHLFEAQNAQFEAQKRMIKASTMPRLGLFAQGFYGNPGLNLFKDMMESKWTWNYIAGIRLQWSFGNFYTKKGNLRKLELAQKQIESQKETFLYNNRLEQIQQQNALEKMHRMMTDDEEIIALRTSIRKASEAKLTNGTITVNDLLKDITNENQAMLSKSIHEIEWLKNIYELKNTTNN